MFLFTNTFYNLIGTLTCLYFMVKFSWKLLFGIRIYVLSKFWRIDLMSFGEWAVVTGATNGIGKAYAHELARRGLNIVLISRSLERLKATAQEIEQQHGKKTKIIQADFTSEADIYGPIEAALKDLNIGILVNNVGRTYAVLPCYFLDRPNVQKAVTDIVNCNALSVPMMTSIVLPQMIKRKKGVIINISSEAGSHPHPLLSIYAATKVFIDFFSRALNAEYKSQGIIIQSVMPLFVSTNLTHDMKASFFVKQADDYVREALNTVGITDQAKGCIAHALQHFIIKTLFPEWVRLSQTCIRTLLKANEKQKPVVEKWLKKFKTSIRRKSSDVLSWTPKLHINSQVRHTSTPSVPLMKQPMAPALASSAPLESKGPEWKQGILDPKALPKKKTQNRLLRARRSLECGQTGCFKGEKYVLTEDIVHMKCRSLLHVRKGLKSTKDD